MIVLLLLSLGMTTIVAFLIALGFYFVAPSLAYAIFWITFGIEWVIMEPLNRILRARTLREEGKTLAKLTKYEEALGKQTIALECEYCSEANAIKVDLNSTNIFTCSKCGNDNKIVIQFSTIRITNPMDSIALDDTDIVDEMDEEND